MRRKNLLRVYATAACAALAASLVSVVPTTASAAEVKPKEAQKLASVPGGTVPVKPPAKSTNEVLQGTPAVNWPTATAAEVSLTKNKAMKAGSAPVSLTSTTDAKVKLEVLSQAESAKAGVAGVLVKVTRSDQAKTAAPVSVTVDYSGFRNAYGGDWAARLRLVPLAGNRTPIPVKNDFKTGKLTGQVTAPKQGATYALTAGDDSTAGDYKATSLSPSGEWQVSAQTGSFSWKYPMRVPPVPGDLTPTLAATYNSGAVDGRVPSANNQTSWLGEGWDLASGSIERRYKGCADDPGSQGKDLTADLCWSLDNATLSLDGHSSELVKDGSTDNWRLKNDDGSKLEHLYGTSNGDENGEYWRLTTIDGTQYNFGLNKIPNRADTQSAWTVPVAGNNANEPCSKATFATSFCDQAYRWNLDYVVDPHGNTVIYTYTKDLNKYGRNLGTATASYTRSGALQMIEYGTKAGVAGNAPARVLFGTTDRCAPGANCATKTPQSWPDVPWDRECTGNTCPEKYSPTFWSTQKLSTVTTQILGSTATCQADATGYCGVDRWSLEHTYPKPGDNSDPALWLDAIKHAGLVGGTTAPLTTSFVLDPINKANRVDSSPDGLPPGNKHRIRDINTESGGQIEVNYARPSCRPGATPAPDNNTALCYPVRWAPDKADVTDDWFNKYVVSSIALIDRVGGGPTQFTHYDYEGTPGWAYRDDPMTPEKYRSWTDWRGFDQVLVRTGDPDSPGDKAESATRYRYFRGLNGDKIKAGGNRTVKVDGIADDPALAGFLREEITLDGPKGAEVTASVNDPWQHGPTATQGTTKATMVKVGATFTRTALKSGGVRRTEVRTTFDEGFGQTTAGQPTKVDDLGDVADPNDDRCTTTTYAQNAGTWLLSMPSRVQTVGVACGVTPSLPKDSIADTRSYYDNAALGSIQAGDLTKVEKLAATGPTQYTVSARTSYDGYGRELETYDALDHKTTKSYQDQGGLLRSTVQTNALGHTSTTTFDPAWGVQAASVDANATRTDLAYDGLGRISQVWAPGRSKATGQGASMKFDYDMRADGASSISTQKLMPNSNYVTSVALFDGFLRARQTQDASPQLGSQTGKGRKLTDTLYNARGLAARTNAVYYNDQAMPDKSLFQPEDAQIPNQTVIEYDGVNRQVKSTYEKLNTPQWSSTTAYSGDSVTVVPPPGGTASTTFTDARGNNTEVRQYLNGTASGAYNSTRTAYTNSGEVAAITDAVNNVWTSSYDVAGNKTVNADPDKGTGRFTYDALGQTLTSTDARGQVTANVYDALGRQTELHKDSPTGELLAKWTYDTLKKGQLDATIRYVDGKEYVNKTTAYDEANRPVDVEVTVPDSEGGLKGTYKTHTAYLADGSVGSVELPALGADLPKETVVYRYNNLGLPTTTTSGGVTYVSASTYTALGEPTQVQLGADGKRLWQTVYYEDGTRRLASSLVERETATAVKVDETAYNYDPTGNVKQIDNTTAGSAPDRQCLNYDGMRRLTDAWTTTAADCSTVGAALGGPAPYWNTYRPDAIGRRLSQTQHGVGGMGSTTTTMTYPAAGEAQPHAPATVSVSGAKRATSASGGYSYDNVGNTTSRPTGSGAQTYTWDATGQLAAVKVEGKTTSYINTPDNARLLAKQDTMATLYLTSGEIKLDKASGKVSGTRYIMHGGQPIAAKTSDGRTSYLLGDSQGTSNLAVDANTLQPTKRRFDPFGLPRGTASAAWPGERGFVGGAKDGSTGLTRLGVRDYDANTGKFLSVDPVLDTENPQHLDAYSYSYNNPATFSDPTGKMPWDEEQEMRALKLRSQGRNADADRVIAAVDDRQRRESAIAKVWNVPGPSCDKGGNCRVGYKGKTPAQHAQADKEEASAKRAETERRAKIVEDELKKHSRSKEFDDVHQAIVDAMYGVSSLSVCGGGSAAALVIGMGLEVCINVDLTGIAVSFTSKVGADFGAGVEASLTFRTNGTAADQVGAGMSVSAEAGIEIKAVVGGGAKYGLEMGMDGKVTSSAGVSVGVGAKVSGGNVMLNVGWNSGYLMRWDQPIGDYQSEDPYPVGPM